jgi:alpha-glucosidase
MCFGKVMSNVHASPDDERRVQIFPVRGTSDRKTFIMYEDDGDTLYHETGDAYAEIHIWMETTETEIHVGLEIVNDGFFPYYDTVWVTCPIASETRKLIFEGQDDDESMSYKLNSKKYPRFVEDESMHVYTGLKLKFDKKK